MQFRCQISRRSFPSRAILSSQLHLAFAGTPDPLCPSGQSSRKRKVGRFSKWDLYPRLRTSPTVCIFFTHSLTTTLFSLPHCSLNNGSPPILSRCHHRRQIPALHPFHPLPPLRPPSREPVRTLLYRPQWRPGRREDHARVRPRAHLAGGKGPRDAGVQHR